MKYSTHPGALLAGVCSRLARLFRCNVWILRLCFVLMLAVKTLPAVLVYAVLAVLLRLTDRRDASKPNPQSDFSLQSAPLASRSRRIDELDRRFRDWERTLSR